MKISIGNYPSRLTCNIHTRYMDKKYGYVDWPEEQTRFERSLELFEDRVQSVYNVFNWIWYESYQEKQQDAKYVKRLEIIDESGRAYVNMNVSECTISIQDTGNTMKLFVSTDEDTVYKYSVMYKDNKDQK